MEEPISAAEANRSFSQLLRGVREQGATYVVTAHGKPIAKIIPFESSSEMSDAARKTLLERLASEPIVQIGRWSREELYERDR
jgi:prevent-host-death family protein